jgi:hypothetical protein
VRLRGILEDEQSVTIGNSIDGRHVRGLAVEVDDEDRGCALTDRGLGGLRGDQAGSELDVAEHRVAPAWAAASTDPMNVWAGTITSSPAPIPASIAMVSAAVPDATPTQ